MKLHKQDRRSRRTRRLVSAAMTQLLLEKRYDAITVQDLLDRAEIGRSTFYTHYFDKEDVLTSLVEHLLETLDQQHSQRDSKQGIVSSLELFRFAYQRHSPQQLQTMMCGRGGEVLWERAQAHLSKTIEQALAANHTETGSPVVPLEAVSQYLAGAFLNLFKWWLEADMPYPPEQMEDIFQQLTLRGVWATIEGN